MNPFLSTSRFIGRTQEIRKIVNRTANGGQSVAIIGEPRIGKSSLLRYFESPENRSAWFGDLDTHLIIKYIDIQPFSPTFKQSEFWQLALQPLAEKLVEINQPTLTTSYETCESEGFGFFGLERVMTQLQSLGWRIIILLDELDSLLNHPVLNKAEFYGVLRSLATRYESLALVTASRQQLEKLNEATQEYSLMGSPYFNFMYPLSLGSLEEKDALFFLTESEENFSKKDKEFLLYVAGGHPFLLNSAATALCEEFENGVTNRTTRWEGASRNLLRTVRPTLSDTWRGWSPETRKAVTIIALDALPRIVSGKEFDIESLLATLPVYSPETDELKERGFLVIDQSRSGFRLQSQVMMWWLASELIRATRRQDTNDLGEWLRMQEWDGLLKNEEIAQLKKALTALGDLLKTGAEAIVKTSVEGFIKGLK